VSSRWWCFLAWPGGEWIFFGFFFFSLTFFFAPVYGINLSPMDSTKYTAIPRNASM
jgi:hypothetical protein